MFLFRNGNPDVISVLSLTATFQEARCRAASFQDVDQFVQNCGMSKGGIAPKW